MLIKVTITNLLIAQAILSYYKDGFVLTTSQKIIFESLTAPTLLKTAMLG